jgi:hypothetical protein
MYWPLTVRMNFLQGDLDGVEQEIGRFLRHGQVEQQIIAQLGGRAPSGT